MAAVEEESTNAYLIKGRLGLTGGLTKKQLKSPLSEADVLSALLDKDKDFGRMASILLIGDPAMRLLAYFFNQSDVSQIKDTANAKPILLGHLHGSCVESYFLKEGFDFTGTFNLDQHGNMIPSTKKTHSFSDGSTTTFVTAGFQFFRHPATKESIATFCTTRDDIHIVTIFSVSQERSNEIMIGLEEHTKASCFLKGRQVRDLQIFAGSFEEVRPDAGDTFERFFYPSHIEEIVEFDIKRFFDYRAEFKAKGIGKRGVLFQGPPGTGKTSLGRIMCNMVDETILWITPEAVYENHSNIRMSLKTIYDLANFLSPCLVILEDIDLFAGSRSQTDGVQLGSLMNILDGINSGDGLVTVGMTNQPRMMEQAVANRPGRFDRVVAVPAMNEELRRTYFNDRLGKYEASDDMIEHMVANTDGDEWTGARCDGLVKTIEMIRIGEETDDQPLRQEVVERALSMMAKYEFNESVREATGEGADIGFGKR